MPNPLWEGVSQPRNPLWEGLSEPESIGLGSRAWRSFLSSAATIPGVAAEGLQTLSEVSRFFNPGQWIPGMQGHMRESFDRFDEFLDPLEQRAREIAPPPGETFVEKAVGTVAGAVPQLAVTVGSALATGGATAPAAIGGLLAAGSSRQEAEARGVDPTTTTLKSVFSGIGGGALEAVGAGAVARLFRQVPTSLLRRTGEAMIAEGATEVGQELLEMTLERSTGSETAFDNAGERLALAGIAGTVLGGAAAGPAALFHRASPPPAPLSPEETALFDDVINPSYEQFHTPKPVEQEGLAERVRQGLRRANYEILNQEGPIEELAVKLKKEGLGEEAAQRITELYTGIASKRGMGSVATAAITQRPYTVDPSNNRSTVLITQVDMGPGGVVQRPEGFRSPLEILSPYGNDPQRLRGLSEFLAHQRNSTDLLRRGKVTPAQAAASQQVVDAIRTQTPDLYQRYIDDAQALREWSVLAILDPLVDVGRITADQKARVLAENPHYAPFFRLEPGGVEAVGADTASLKRIEGGLDPDNPSIDPIEGFVQKAMSVTSWVTRQRLRNTIGAVGVEFADVFPDLAPVPPAIERVATQEVPVLEDEAGQRLKPSQLAKAEGLLRDTGETDLENVYRPRRDRPPNTFQVWKDGKPVNFTADKLLLSAIERLSPQELAWGWKLLRPAAAMLRAGATSTPEFILTNMLFRDTVASAVFAKGGFVPFWDTAIGIAEALKRGPLLDEMARSGGLISNLVDVDRDFYVHDVQDLLAYDKSKNFLQRELGHFRAALKKPGRSVLKYKKGQSSLLDLVTDMPTDLVNIVLHPLQRLSAVAEMANRLGAAKRAAEGSRVLGPISERLAGVVGEKWAPRFRTEGLGVEGVLEAMREPSIDFGRMGAWGSRVNSVEAFANANLQDVSKYARALKAAPGHTLLASTVMVTIPAIVNWLANKDDERHAERSMLEKTLYYHDPGVLNEHGESLRFPRPIGVFNFLHGVLVEKLLDKFYERDPSIKEELFEALQRDTPAGMVWPPTNMIPTALQSPFEAFGSEQGYDSFRDRPLVNQGMMRRAPELRYSEWTSETMKQLGELTGVAPVKLEHVYRNWTGTAGRWLTDAVDATVFGEQPGERPPGIVGQAPFALRGIARRFISAAPAGPGSRPVSDFYTFTRKAEEQRQSMKFELDRGAARDALAEKYPLALYSRGLSRAARNMSEISKDRAVAVEDGDFDEVKRLDRLMTEEAQRQLERAGVYRSRKKPELDAAVEKQLAAWIRVHPDAAPWERIAARKRILSELSER